MPVCYFASVTHHCSDKCIVLFCSFNKNMAENKERARGMQGETGHTEEAQVCSNEKEED